MKNWSAGKTLACFLAAVVAVHAAVIAFHLAMLAEWPVGRVLRHFYYSRSPHGVKETWPLIDYYLPTMFLAVATAGLLRFRSIFLHLAGWILCCVTVVGPLPIYSTRLVPTPVSTWGTPRPPPFERLPENSPFLLVVSVASILARYSARAEAS